MRIIKEGVNPDTVEVIKTCGKCTAEFGVVKADIQSDYKDGSYVVCPTCKSFIAINCAEFLDKAALTRK